MSEDRLITVAIYTYEKAQIIKGILENEGIPVAIQNVNLIQPVVSSGVRIRIRENDLPLALKYLKTALFLKICCRTRHRRIERIRYWFLSISPIIL